MDAVTTPDTLRGIDLRLRRLERRVTAAAVARAAGWSRSRVSNIEQTDLPTSRARQRYLAGLERAAAER
jgi:transcriptional regulator with XRE-family HTH domain